MPRALIALMSFVLYGSIFYFILAKRRFVLSLIDWPEPPTLKSAWYIWLVFLITLAPLSFLPFDMAVWVEAMQSQLSGLPLPDSYVYLPVYAQILAALYFPVSLIFGAINSFVTTYIIHAPVLAAYVFSTGAMTKLLPRQSQLAPLAVAFAPVTIFYLFFGTNHIVMLACLLASLLLLQRQQAILAGLFAGLGCYKFLLIPSILVLMVVILLRYGRKPLMQFCIGGVLSLIPSFVYYAFHWDLFTTTLSSFGAIGGHSHHIEPFHFLYIPSKLLPSLEAVYLQARVWFILVLIGTFLCTLLYWKRVINSFQAIGISAGIVALFSLEPFRLEPAIGMLWLDALYRKDYRTQTTIIFVLFLHAAVWYPSANFRLFDFVAGFERLPWAAGGFVLGLFLILALVQSAMGRRTSGDPIDLPAAQT